MQVLLFQLGKESIKKELKKPNGVNTLLTKYPYSFSPYTIFDRWNSSVTGLLDGVQQLRLCGETEKAVGGQRCCCWNMLFFPTKEACTNGKRKELSQKKTLLTQLLYSTCITAEEVNCYNLLHACPQLGF